MKITTFNGLQNVSDPLTLGLGWLATADNVDVTDAGKLVKRAGYGAPVAGAFTGAFSTKDFQRAYLVDGGAIKTIDGLATLATGITPEPMHWTQINGQVFFNNGTSRGIIQPDNTVIPWDWEIPPMPELAAVTGKLAAGQYQVAFSYTLQDGRETGIGDPATITLGEGQAISITGMDALVNIYIAPANSTVYQFARATSSATVWNYGPNTLGADLLNDGMDPLPEGATLIQEWRGRVFAAKYLPSEDQTVIWFSQPLGFHLFNLAQDFILVPGQVHMLANAGAALIVGTDRAIHAYDGESLAVLADYGVVPGWHDSTDAGQTYFWSTRGLCSALPFTNLTESHVSVAPGVQAGGTIVRSGGQKRYLVALHQGGLAHNPFV